MSEYRVFYRVDDSEGEVVSKSEYDRAVRGQSARAADKTERVEDMSLTDDALISIAKAVAAGERVTLPPKSVWYAAIQKRAAEFCRDGRRSAEGKFSDCVVNDPVGRTLFAAMRKASGAEVLEDDSATADEPSSKPFVGAAGKRMQALADLYRARNPQHSKEGAYSRVFRANPQLGEEVKQEVLAKNYGG
jgi:hypothetical protein